ncbi:MAG: signal peptidase I [Chloroflexota bacterium]
MAIRLLQLGTRLAWLSAACAVISVALLPHALSAVGREMYVVRGASMEPAIPIGSVVLVRPVDPATIVTGNVITFHAPNGALVSHRVIGLAEGTSLAFQTKGDGSSAADPIIVPATSVVGVVESLVPQLGYFITALGTTAGVVAVLALLCGLLLTSWFMDELAATMARPTHRRMAAAEPAI